MVTYILSHMKPNTNLIAWHPIPLWPHFTSWMSTFTFFNTMWIHPQTQKVFPFRQHGAFWAHPFCPWWLFRFLRRHFSAGGTSEICTHEKNERLFTLDLFFWPSVCGRLLINTMHLPFWFILNAIIRGLCVIRQLLSNTVAAVDAVF